MKDLKIKSNMGSASGKGYGGDPGPLLLPIVAPGRADAKKESVTKVRIR